MQHEHVMMGGPVQIDRGYVVHTPVGNWQNSMIVSDDIALTSSRDVIENLSRQGAVDKILISIGYSSWSKGQLERELADNVWLTVKADEHILFDMPYEHRYAAAFANWVFSPMRLSVEPVMHKAPVGTVLAFDFGEARIGVAQGDAERLVASFGDCDRQQQRREIQTPSPS